MFLLSTKEYSMRQTSHKPWEKDKRLKYMEDTLPSQNHHFICEHRLAYQKEEHRNSRKEIKLKAYLFMSLLGHLWRKGWVESLWRGLRWPSSSSLDSTSTSLSLIWWGWSLLLLSSWSLLLLLLERNPSLAMTREI